MDVSFEILAEDARMVLAASQKNTTQTDYENNIDDNNETSGLH